MTTITVLDSIPNVGRPNTQGSRHIERVNRTLEANPGKFVELCRGSKAQRASLYRLSQRVNRGAVDGLLPNVVAYTRTINGEVYVYLHQSV